MSSIENKETRDNRLETQSAEQFEALGRFVQAFEHMVNAARTGIIWMNGSGPKQQHLVRIIASHAAMTAKPLFDVFRATTNSIASAPDYNIPIEEKILVENLLRDVAGRYEKLLKMRNNLLHGTWYIGWASAAQTSFDEFRVIKHDVSAKGISIANNPSTIQEIHLQIDKCKSLTHIISLIPTTLLMCIRKEQEDLWPTRVFYKNGDLWAAKGKFHG